MYDIVCVNNEDGRLVYIRLKQFVSKGMTES